jgi:hypothetical protein
MTGAGFQVRFEFGSAVIVFELNRNDELPRFEQGSVNRLPCVVGLQAFFQA